MEVGVGLPAGVPGAPGDLVLDWARRADSGPFSSLGVIDRVAYDNYDPFLSLAAAAAVTSRLWLVTMVVIGPLRNQAMLAKEAAALDALSGGRLTLGTAIGARHGDYDVMGIDHRDRGQRFDAQLAYLREAFQDGGRVGPRPAQPNGPDLLVGGATGRAFARMARYGDGYVHGGGPPGLYFALLMKKADPGHQVRVIERNPPDATFGWGVVFSEETLGALRDADYETYIEITDTFAKWNAIDVRYRDQTIRSRGHAFSGIARKELLRILQQRCRQLGVRLEFEREVADLEPFRDDDLVVAADGVHSLARRLHEPRFEPRLDLHTTKYAWFGADLAVDAFTFIFRDTGHGLFQVHAYPFDAHTSTFIVEAHESTWRRAGLDQMPEEESLRFCEDLFRPELGDHKLLSNRSIWFTFVTLRNRNWHHGKIVLLGDAAHTAHFTIGSGTKLAMEDAISLATAFLRHPAGLEAALTWYELDRQPVVERFQEAARESATYFENVSRYRGFEPIQFAFNLLTRSGRISRLELEKRDPRFVAAVDRRFARTAAGGPGGTAPGATAAGAPSAAGSTAPSARA